MKILGRCLLGIVAFVPLFLLGSFFSKGEISNFFGGAALLAFISAHLFMMVGEMVSHSEIPTRGLAMKCLWGGFFILLLVANLAG